MGCQAVAPQAAVKALRESILHWLSWSDVVRVDLSVLGPAQDHHAGELSPVVKGDGVRLPTAGDELIKLSGDPQAGQ